LDRAVTSNLKPFLKVALILCRHLDGLLAYFGYRLSSGPIEGLNNKIKTLKRQAYGYRDMHFFLLRVLFIHESIYTITG
jgi:transposase